MSNLNTEVIHILEDGSLDLDKTYILADIYSLNNPERKLKDLRKFLKISKGIQGDIKFYLDTEKTEEMTDDNYGLLKSKAIGGRLYFTATE